MNEFHPSDPATAAIRNAATQWIGRRDKGLSTTEQIEFETWLDADSRHRAAFDWYNSAWSALDRPVLGGAVSDVLEIVTAMDRARTRRRFATASGVMASVLLVGALWTFPRQQDRADVRPTLTAKVLQPDRQVLPDGTDVELKDGASIRVEYSDEIRKVFLLRGEAHFQVQKNPARPFVVVANGIDVRAVGTAFNVQMAEGAVEVIVTEGRVAVEQSSPADPLVAAPPDASIPLKSLATVDAGSRVIVATSTPTPDLPVVTAIPRTEMLERLDWRTTRLEFTGTPLAEVVALLNRDLARRKGPRLVLAEPELGGIRISGLFRSDNTNALIDLLESGFGISADTQNNREIVLRRAR